MSRATADDLYRIRCVEEGLQVYPMLRQQHRRAEQVINVKRTGAAIGVSQTDTEPGRDSIRIGNTVFFEVPPCVDRPLGAGGNGYEMPAEPHVRIETDR